jgi:MFS family permease
MTELREKADTRSGQRAMGALSLCVLLTSVGMSIANVALPALAEAFDATFRQVQWVVVSYLLANMLLVVNVGRLGDVVGRRRLLLAGLLLFGGASVLAGFAPVLAMLDAARAVQGVGAAMMMALAMALVGESVPKERIGGAMGLLGTMSAIGTASGPAFGGFLVSWLGWRAVFFVTAPPALLAYFLARRYLPLDAAPGASRGGLLEMRRALTAPLAASLAMNALVTTVMMATLVVGPFYLVRGLALDLGVVGIVMAVGPAVSALVGVPAGRMVDRFGPSRMVMTGAAGLALGCIALSQAPMAWGVAGYAIPLAILTSQYALFQAANNTAVLKEVPSSRRGLVSGMLNLSRSAGFVAGASLMGSLFASASGAADPAQSSLEDVRLGMSTTFAVAAVFMIAAFMIAARIGKMGSAPLFRHEERHEAQ